MAASKTTSSKLEQKVKEPKKLIFFRGAIFKIVFNKEGNFSHSLGVFLFDLPSQEDLAMWRKIKILKAPLGPINI